MDSVEFVLAMILAVLAGGYLVRVLPFTLPLPLAQIALGALIAMAFGRSVVLDPDIFFLLFLPPLLFLDGWRIPKGGPFRDKAAILELALGLVVFTVLGAGFLIHWLIPAMPLAVAFALAAIVSPTDPVALSSITARVPIPKRLMHILQGESLLNDASGLVCFRFAVAAALTGSFSLTSALLTFLWVALAGLSLGVAVTLGISSAQLWLSKRIGDENGAPILINLVTPFCAYLLAEALHASGILAAVAAGITMSYVELSGQALATTRVQRAAVWDTVQFALNGIMFVLLGEQLPGIFRRALTSVTQSGHLNPGWLVVYALTIYLGLTLLRFIWAWTSLRTTLLRRRHQTERAVRPNWRLPLTTSVAGVRGAVTLAGVLTLPMLMPNGDAFPSRDLAVFLAAAVILFSLAVASMGLPRLLRGLVLPEEPVEQLQEDNARRDAALAAIAAVEYATHHTAPQTENSELYAQAAAHVLGLYRHRLDGSTESAHSPAQLRDAVLAERTLRLTALQAERDKIFSLARHSRLSDEIARKLVREIDLVESRYR
jgi:CPA1 family monovalent cation:H+ antiporter